MILTFPSKPNRVTSFEFIWVLNGTSYLSIKFKLKSTGSLFFRMPFTASTVYTETPAPFIFDTTSDRFTPSILSLSSSNPAIPTSSISPSSASLAISFKTLLGFWVLSKADEICKSFILSGFEASVKSKVSAPLPFRKSKLNLFFKKAFAIL